MNEKIHRFEQAIATRKDRKLAEFWNEIEIEHQNSADGIGSMLAFSKFLLSKQQIENHKLMIEFLQEMETAKTRINDRY